MSATAAAQVEITHEVGLHARPSVKFTKLPRRLRPMSKWLLRPTDPGSTRKHRQGHGHEGAERTMLHFRASGDDAESAVEALVELVERDFDEAPRAKPMSGPLRLRERPLPEAMRKARSSAWTAMRASYVAKGSAAAEAQTLKAAIEAASEQLAVLAAASTGEAARHAGVPAAMLEDDSLSAPAFDAIDAGRTADEAWADALAAEIAGYEAADDEYFRARAADLKDIRERVLRALTGPGSDGSARRDPVRRGHRADAVPGDRLVGRRRHRARRRAARRAMSPCWRARAACRWWSGSASAAKDVAGLALLDAEHGGIVLRPTERDIEGFRKSSTAYGERRRRAEDARDEAGGDRERRCRCACWSTSPIPGRSTAST